MTDDGGFDLEMTLTDFQNIFSAETLHSLFPKDRADHFFEALFGDVSEGAYDISLGFTAATPDALHFEFQLKRRTGKCLVCSLTYGLPQVFGKHPVIDVKGLVHKIGSLMNGHAACSGWRIGSTQEVSKDLHVIPLTIRISPPTDIPNPSEG